MRCKMKLEKWQGVISLYDPIYRPKQKNKNTTMPLWPNTRKMVKQG
jgi:hypothetical protein